jgi:RND family efflux transporter MFP subunit
VRSIKHVVLFGVVAVVAVACGGPPPAPPPPPPRPVDVITLQPRPVRDTGEYLGSLLSRGSVTVLPQGGGYIKAIHVRPGQSVKAGAALVEIDAREEAAAVESAVAQQSAAQARLEQAQQTVQRTQALFDEGLAPAQELERAKADVAAADAAVKVAAAAVEQKNVSLQFHTVRAPVSGTIGEIPARVGDAVTPVTSLMSIAEASVLELSVALPAARARDLRPNTPVEILDAEGAPLVKTTVFYAAPQADPVTQLVVVKAAFENDVRLRPSEMVRARVVFSEGEALQVPSLAVTRQSGQAFLFVVVDKDGKAVVQRRPVQLGKLNGQSYVVDSGVVAGDRVAVSSLQSLRDGAPVVPKTVEATTTAASATPPDAASPSTSTDAKAAPPPGR